VGPDKVKIFHGPDPRKVEAEYNAWMEGRDRDDAVLMGRTDMRTSPFTGPFGQGFCWVTIFQFYKDNPTPKSRP